MTHLVESDSDGRVVLPGHPNQAFLVRVNSDGSLLLQPTSAEAGAQAEYDNSAELRELLRRAADEPTVRRDRTPRD